MQKVTRYKSVAGGTMQRLTRYKWEGSQEDVAVREGLTWMLNNTNDAAIITDEERKTVRKILSGSEFQATDIMETSTFMSKAITYQETLMSNSVEPIRSSKQQLITAWRAVLLQFGKTV